MVGSKIVIGLYITGHVVSVVCSHMWVVWYKIVTIGLYVTGHVVSFVCYHMWVVGSKIVIGLYVPDMWSVLCLFSYVGDGV